MTVMVLIYWLITENTFRIPAIPQYSGSISKITISVQSSTENTAVSVVFASFNYAEIPYDASIFPNHRLRGLDGGPRDNYGFSHLS
jgi:hypothetical protein